MKAARLLAAFTILQAGVLRTQRPLATPTCPHRQTSLHCYACLLPLLLRVPDNMTSRAAVDLWADSAMLSFADFPGRFTVVLNGRKSRRGMASRRAATPLQNPQGILRRKPSTSWRCVSRATL
jgi:hypothetical protein